MTIFKKITEITLLIEKDIKNNKPYRNAVFDQVDEALGDNTPQNKKDIIIMRICDNLQNKGVII